MMGIVGSRKMTLDLASASKSLRIGSVCAEWKAKACKGEQVSERRTGLGSEKDLRHQA